MFNAEFNSWFSDWFKKTGCYVKTDGGVSYVFFFDAENGVIGSAITGEWQ